MQIKEGRRRKRKNEGMWQEFRGQGLTQCKWQEGYVTQSGAGGSKEQYGLSTWRQGVQLQEELQFDQKEQNKNQRWTYQDCAA